MSSSCDPRYAPAGDVSAALMMIDSRLKGVHEGRTESDPEQRAMVGQFIASLGPGGADGVIDGTCTLVYLYMRWLRLAYEDHEEDVIAHVVPDMVATLRMMPRSVPPEAVPTMAGLLVAAGTGLSPSLWRKQYGGWTQDEMTPLEATALLLAERINRMTDDPDFATRMVTEALTSADEE
ncbi:hypothetical protein [Streptomyces sp. ODS28]|uniref:hypothetical protein n=1 Tax=Streptomyces sp. ODS28 TaxID=3136688 RepID=UPI0031E869A2